MASIFQVTVKQIEGLDELQVPVLLRKLLQVEATAAGIPVSSVDIGHDIDIPDGGEDGRIQWTTGVEKTTWIPNRLTTFQIKATALTPAGCAKEILLPMAKTKTKVKKRSKIPKKKPKKTGKRNALKPAVKDVLDKKGAYVLIENKTHMVKRMRDQRIGAIRTAMRSTGHKNWKTCHVDVIDRVRLAQWINQYPQVVSYYFQEFHSFNTSNFSSWETLLKNHQRELKVEFVRNQAIEEIIILITTSALDPKGILRLIGLPGLGKTRILIEAIRKNHALRDALLYLDAKEFKDDSDVMQKIKTLFEFEKQCLLVIDNCSSQLHIRISSEIRDRNISLVTLHHDTEEDDADRTFKIKPDSFKDIIPRLVRKLFPRLADSEVDKIAEFAQGFPLIAVLLSNQIDKNSPNIGVLDDTVLLLRMLGLSTEQKEELNILMGCAIFKNFGFEDVYLGQRDFIATHVNICKLDGNADQMKNKFHQVCIRYIKRGIMEKVGRKVFLKPAPLALRLAADWWKLCRPEIVAPLLEEIKSAELANELCDQVAKLDFLPEAKNITEQLCGPTGPFGNAEVLNTEEGSRLFRSIVEVNPVACIEALEHSFGGMSKSELFAIDKGRRNLVWALEKLCFRAETFFRASKILLAFASAENETWIINSATGQFIRLFQAILSATQATLEQRIEMMEYALSSNDPDYVSLGFKALIKSVQCRDFHRDGGAEDQGSGAPLRDFQPTRDQVRTYWTFGVQRLTDFAISAGEYSQAARERLLESIRRFASVHEAGLILPAARKLAYYFREDWNKITDELNATLKYDTFRLTKGEREEVDQMLIELSPRNFDERYLSIVASPSWHQLTDESEDKDENVIERKVKEFADEFVSENKYQNSEYLINLYQPKQQQGFLFGQAIGLLLQRDDVGAKEFATLSLEALKRIPKEHRNIAVLAGFLLNSSTENKNLFLTKILDDAHLNPFAFSLTVAVHAELRQITSLFPLVDKGLFRISEFTAFKFGRALDHLPSSQVLILIEKILEYKIEGHLTAIQILYMYCHNNENNWRECKAVFRKILLAEGILKSEDTVRMDQYYWSDIVEKLLTEKKDEELAIHVVKETIDLCAGYRLVSKWDSYLKSVMIILINDYFAIVWPFLKTALLSEKEDYDIYFCLKNILGSHISSYGMQESILLQGDGNEILKWCEENLPIAPVRMMSMAPVFSNKTKSGKQSLHPFTRTLLDRFGDLDGILPALQANMGTYSWTGSIVPLINGKIELMVELKNHPIQEVRSWAIKMEEYLKKEMKKESNEDAERFL